MDEQRDARVRLPPEIYEFAIRAGSDAGRSVASISLRQTGRMRQDRDTRWMSFRATQIISANSCAFEWKARVGPGGLVVVRDVLRAGEGRLDVRALGLIPLVKNVGSPALTRGELMRYLAELPWAPDAILLNTELRWRKGSAGRFIVGAGTGELAAEVSLTLDDQGQITETFAPDRPRVVKSGIIPTPWRGRFFDYRRSGGNLLAFAGEVGWVIDNELVICWQGRIEGWERVRG